MAKPRISKIIFTLIGSFVAVLSTLMYGPMLLLVIGKLALNVHTWFFGPGTTGFSIFAIIAKFAIILVLTWQTYCWIMNWREKKEDEKLKEIERERQMDEFFELDRFSQQMIETKQRNESKK